MEKSGLSWHRVAPSGAKVASVKSLVHICLVAGVFALCLPARSETLRCNGHIVETGDSRLSVRYHCGEPLLQDSYCAPVYYAPGLQRGARAVCQLGFSLSGGR